MTRIMIAAVVAVLTVATDGYSGPGVANATKFDLVGWNLELVEHSNRPGSATLRLTLQKNYNCCPDLGFVCCTDLLIEPWTEGGLTYTGEPSWTVHVDSGAVYRKDLPIVLPPADTCAFFFTMDCDCFRGTAGIYFVTGPDTVRVYPGNPRRPPERHPRPKPSGRIGDIIPGEFPLEDSLYGIPEPEPQPDSTRRLEYFTVDLPQSERERLRAKELSRPMGVHASHQTDSAVSFTGTPLDMQKYAEAPDSATFSVCLDLRAERARQEAVALLRALTGEQVQPEFYHMEVSKRNIELLRSAEVPLLLIGNPPHKHLWPIDEDSVLDTTGGASYLTPSDSRSTLFYEGFGYDWFYRWESVDSTVTCGYDSWDALGYGRMWCAGSGDLPFESIYDCFMNSFLLSDWINMGEAPSAWIGLSLRYQMSASFANNTLFLIDDYGD
jgi:hypothetical protein